MFLSRQELYTLSKVYLHTLFDKPQTLRELEHSEDTFTTLYKLLDVTIKNIVFNYTLYRSEILPKPWICRHEPCLGDPLPNSINGLAQVLVPIRRPLIHILP
ncbi:hypothetical protein SAMN05421736_101132 [Evansella caseinilytica]|uniref:Uncharacterized protein n=1 Tax=Evansella caseinilytica TaxID=1503961 RepID=A0A1H3GD92_9BACI|nr:hypothetical protein SAMN05421736_101132 [Evansella caseinilytica]